VLCPLVRPLLPLAGASKLVSDTSLLVAGLLYAGSLWLSNSSYLYLSVSFIQVGHLRVNWSWWDLLIPFLFPNR
jgi:hypothetical protein